MPWTKLFLIFLLGFSSGLPLALSLGTLQAWLTDAGVSIQDIGIFAAVTAPYSLKFLWSPVVDRFLPPFGGRRRGWIVISVVLLTAALLTLSQLSPQENLLLFGSVVLVVSFLSATQDIAVDAYRVELLSERELGPGASAGIYGYRVGMLVSGAGALALGDHLSWPQVYQLMAVLQLVGMAVALFAPEPAEHASTRVTSLRAATIEPLREYFQRSGAFELLLFILLYKLTDVMGAMFQTTFLLQLGFTKTDIAAVVKGFGLGASLVGALIGGALTMRIGMKRALLVFGALQGASTMVFAWLASVGPSTGALIVALGIENLCGGLGSAAFTAFLMGLCNRRYTATQYALLTSLAATSRSLIGAPCGVLAAAVSWQSYFVISTLVAIPALVLIALRYERWSGPITSTEKPVDA